MKDERKTRKQLIAELEAARQQAEAQERLLRQEAALERVRTRVVGMEQSGDLPGVVDVVEQALTDLGVPCVVVGINVIDETTRVVRLSFARPAFGVFECDLDELLARNRSRPGSAAMYSHWKEGATWCRSVTAAEDEATLRAYAAAITDEAQRRRVLSMPRVHADWHVVDAPFAHGTLAMRKPGLEPFADDHVRLLQRFTEVFALGYTRYLDLQAAERRAAQARREAAYERVRSQVLASRNTDGILAAAMLMERELRGLGVRLSSSGINLIDEGAGLFRQFAASVGWADASAVPIDAHPQVAAVVEHWRQQRPFMRPATWDEQTLEQADPGLRAALQSMKVIVDVPFAYGTLAMNSAEVEAFSEEEVAMLQGFADVISLAYTRYLDFQQLEAQNRAIQQATRHKSDFLSRMSHDLRTPMNAILGYTRILLRRSRGVLEDRQYRNLVNIQTSASNLLVLINEILDLSRIEAGRIDLKLEPVDLDRLVAQCVASVEPLVKPGVKLVQEVEPMSAVTTDPDVVRRVVMNLLGNAVKFTAAGRITVSLRSAEGQCELAVADTGVGIPTEDLPHIFEEFRQVERQVGEKTEGTGLGLAIAKKSMDVLGGAIRAESEVGKGSTFTLRIKDHPSA